MAAIQHILAANQQRHRARSQMVYINAYVRQHFSPLNVLSDRAVQSKYRLPRVEVQRLITLVSPHIQRQPAAILPSARRCSSWPRCVFTQWRASWSWWGTAPASAKHQFHGVWQPWHRSSCAMPGHTSECPPPVPMLSRLTFALVFLVWLWNSFHFFLTAPQSDRPRGLNTKYYICVNGLDYYLDTPVCCDHTHTCARA